MRKIRNNKGFTLIELMIVVVIIGILAAIAIPRFSRVSNRAKQAEAGPILKQICELAQAYQDKNDAAAGGLTDLATVGWDDAVNTNAKYFTFSFTAPNAVATPKVAAVTAETMSCS